MDVEAFLKVARDPDQWREKSVALRLSADRLWEDYFESTLLSLRADRLGDEAGAEAAWRKAVGYLYSSQMLYGLALETAFKSHIVRTLPDGVKIKTKTDESGVVVDAFIEQIGVPLKSGHSLELLAECAGLFEPAEDPLFTTPDDYGALREILKYLSDVVYWSGKYPVPKRPSSAYELPADLPGKVFGHYMPDWTDHVLDRYQGISGDPHATEMLDRFWEIVQRLNAPDTSKK